MSRLIEAQMETQRNARLLEIDNNTIKANLILTTNSYNSRVDFSRPQTPTKSNLNIDNFKYIRTTDSEYSSTESGLANEIFIAIQANLNSFSQFNRFETKQSQQTENSKFYKIRGIISALSLLTVLPLRKELVTSLTAQYIQGIDSVILQILPHESNQDPKLKLNIIACLGDIISQNIRFSDPRFNDRIFKDVKELKNKIQAIYQNQKNFVTGDIIQGINREICASISTDSAWNKIIFDPKNVFDFINNLYQALIGNYGYVDAKNSNSYIYNSVSNTVSETIKLYPYLSTELPFVFKSVLKNLWMSTIFPLLKKQGTHISQMIVIQANFEKSFNYFLLQLEQSKQISNQNSSSKLKELKLYLTK